MLIINKVTVANTDSTSYKNKKLYTELKEIEHCLLRDLNALRCLIISIEKRLIELNREYPDTPTYILGWPSDCELRIVSCDEKGNYDEKSVVAIIRCIPAKNIFWADEEGGYDEKAVATILTCTPVKNIFRSNENKLVEIEEKGGEA